MSSIVIYSLNGCGYSKSSVEILKIKVLTQIYIILDGSKKKKYKDKITCQLFHRYF